MKDFIVDEEWIKENYHGEEIFTIPDGATAIANGAFWRCTALRHIDIPESVKDIGVGAFCGCSALESIEIPDSVTKIKSFTFLGCDNLRTVHLPEGVTAIEIAAFGSCTNLKEINQPHSIRELDPCAFAGCKTLHEMNNELNTAYGYDYVGGSNDYFLNMIYEEKEAGLPEIVLPKTDLHYFLSERMDALSNAKYPAFIIPSEIKDCLDSQIAKEDAFMVFPVEASGCLRSLISKPAEVQICPQIDEKWVNKYWNALFDDKTQSFTIPDGVKMIDDSAFAGRRMKSVSIPDSVTSIGAGAFSCCDKLTSVTIPDSVTRIGERAFEVCNDLTYVSIPDSVTSIGTEAFAGCSRLTSVVIPDSVREIDDCAFAECKSLQEFTFPKEMDHIGCRIFSNCTSLQTVRMPLSAKEIEGKIFDRLPLHGINSTDGAVISVGDKIADDYVVVGDLLVTKLEQRQAEVLEIPEGVQRIAPMAFSGNDNCTGVLIPDGVREIGERAFYGCKGLKSVQLPESVQEIGEDAFDKYVNIEHTNETALNKDELFEGMSQIVTECQAQLNKLEALLSALNERSISEPVLKEELEEPKRTPKQVGR